MHQGEGGTAQHLGWRKVHRSTAPDELHHLEQDVGKSEGHQQLGHMAELVHLAQCEALDHRTHDTHQHRGDDQRRPEADPAGQRVAHVGAHHVETGVRKIEDAHHAEDEGQPRAQHEQQQTVADAVEHGDDEELHEFAFRGWCVSRRSTVKTNQRLKRRWFYPRQPPCTKPDSRAAVQSISLAASSGSWWACWRCRKGIPSQGPASCRCSPGCTETCRRPFARPQRTAAAATGDPACAFPLRR